MRAREGRYGEKGRKITVAVGQESLVLRRRAMFAERERERERESAELPSHSCEYRDVREGGP